MLQDTANVPASQQPNATSYVIYPRIHVSRTKKRNRQEESRNGEGERESETNKKKNKRKKQRRTRLLAERRRRLAACSAPSLANLQIFCHVSLYEALSHAAGAKVSTVHFGAHTPNPKRPLSVGRLSIFGT